MSVVSKKLLREYIEAVRSNNHKAIRELFATSPICGHDYASTVCQCGCPDSIALVDTVLYDTQNPEHTFIRTISDDTIRLLFELGIFKTTDMYFFEKLICHAACPADCERAYSLIDIFDEKTIASHIQTYTEADIDPETGKHPSANALSYMIQSFALDIPIYFRHLFIRLFNMFLAMGVKFDDLSKDHKKHLLKYIDYDHETNTVIQSSEKFATELTVYLKDRTLSDDVTVYLNDTLKRCGLCYVPESKTVVGFVPL